MTPWLYRPAVSHQSPQPHCVICHQQRIGEVSPLLGGHVCYFCLARKSYNAANTLQIGAQDGLPLFSIEFEVAAEKVSEVQWQRTLLLLQYGYLRTEDSTVDDEYKSPIYRSLDAFLPVLPCLDSLKDCVTERCGTHIHIDCPYKKQLYDCEHEVFSPLERYMLARREETLAFWGRAWISGCGFTSCTRYETLEFRLPRFRTASQYLAVVQFCRQAGRLINEYLLSLQQHLSSNQSSIGDDLLQLYRQTLAQLPAKAS